jgi:hypothetical protein
MKRDIMIWSPERKSILWHLVKPSSPDPALDGKLMLIWYRFSHEATIIISYRFLFEAIGKSRMRTGSLFSFEIHPYHLLCERLLFFALLIPG